VRARTENALLVVAALSVVAFLVSFGLGLRGRAASTDRLTPDSIAADDFLNRGRAPRVEVLNGAGRSGMARAATDRLRGAGFDVVFFGNARTSTDTSYVLDRVGRPAAARAVAQALGISRVHTAVDSALFLEATVVLGRDLQIREPE
jgi:hypothetical protein